MDKTRKPISKRTNLIFFPMFLFIACIITCIVICLTSYNKTFKFYTEDFYAIAEFDSEFNSFTAGVQEYEKISADGNFNEVVRDFNSLLKVTSNLYRNRFDFNKASIVEIENIYNTINQDIKADISAVETAGIPIEFTELSVHIARVSNYVNNIMRSTVDVGNNAYKNRRIMVIVCEILMIVIFVAFVGVAVYVIVFIKKKIANPLTDISEWAKLFKDDYTDMSDIEYDGNDEIRDLIDSFNIVKNKLAESIAIKKENEVTMRKLREEEEYKKKFVKQLYDEKREKETISSEAKRDGLTGLYNRRSFDSIIDDFVGNKPASMEGALFLIDMDNFKSVNDTLGHLAGDEALKTLAGAMRVVFPGGYLGRYGGDEFIAFATGVSSDEELSELGKQLCEKMDRMFEYGGKSTKISVSIGIVNTIGITDYAELYMKADKALYYSKEHGRNQYTLASQIDL